MEGVENLIQGLNDAQRAAVEDYSGATLVIAGAGSGKTRVLTMRIANMLAQGVPAHSIMALTFTNKAAKEMRDRIRKVVPPESLYGLWMGTFHSLFGRILRREAQVLGFPEAYTIYDTADSRNVVKAIIKQMELPEDQYKPAAVVSRISLAKNNLILPAMYQANAKLLEEDRHMKMPQIHQIYEKYMQQCKAAGAMDFDDMLLYMNILMRDYPDVAQKYAQQFAYILVDEYQDTNFSQYLIVKKLASVHGNVCVVGDDSQSIYSFRGARIENILRFQKDYPDAKLFKLEQNYRSTSTIVEAANSLIEKNSQKLPKKLFSEQELGDKIRVIHALSDKEEAMRVASDIHSTMYGRQALASDFAIMYRTNAQSRVMEEYLRGKGIAYRIYGGMSFYQRAEVKDMIAYLRFAVNPDDDQAFLRIINFPARGIGQTSLGRLETQAREAGISIWQLLNRVPVAELGIRGAAVGSLTKFIVAFGDLSARAGSVDAYTLAMEVVGRSGVFAHYQMSKLIEDESRLQNIEELMNSVKTFVDDYAERAQGRRMAEQQALLAAGGGDVLGGGPGSEILLPDGALRSLVVSNPGVVDDTAGSSSSFSASSASSADSSAAVTEIPLLAEWLQEVSLMSDMDQVQDDDTPRVTLLTVHASKGLEFKYTYIVGLEENLFPSVRGTESLDSIEEERRLFYVALTRAETRATLSFSTSRFQWGQVVNSNPSRFIREIDAQYVELPDIFDYLGGGGPLVDDDSDNSPFSRGRVSSSGGGSHGGARFMRKGVSASSGGAAVGRQPVQSAVASGVVDSSRLRKVSSVSGSASGSFSSSSTTSSSSSASAVAGDYVNDASLLAPGVEVVHERFGRGVVESLEQGAVDTKVVVAFAGAGAKTLLLKYAKLKLIK